MAQRRGGSQCHSGTPADHKDHIQRSITSIQGTYAGAIAQVRRSFGAQPDGTAHFGIYAIADDKVVSPKAVPSLAKFDPTATNDPQPVKNFYANCLTCHLTAEPGILPSIHDPHAPMGDFC